MVLFLYFYYHTRDPNSAWDSGQQLDEALVEEETPAEEEVVSEAIEEPGVEGEANPQAEKKILFEESPGRLEAEPRGEEPPILVTSEAATQDVLMEEAPEEQAEAEVRAGNLGY